MSNASKGKATRAEVVRLNLMQAQAGFDGGDQAMLMGGMSAALVVAAQGFGLTLEQFQQTMAETWAVWEKKNSEQRLI